MVMKLQIFLIKKFLRWILVKLNHLGLCSQKKWQVLPARLQIHWEKIIRYINDNLRVLPSDDDSDEEYCFSNERGKTFFPL